MITIIELEEKNDRELRAQGVDEMKESERFKRYREKFNAALDAAIYTKFTEKLNQPTVSDTLREANKLLDDLTDVLDLVVDCFPLDYNIFETFVKKYHLQYNTLMV